MPESAKIILGIFVASFFTSALVYFYPLMGNVTSGADYRVSGKKFLVTFIIIFLILLLGFYLLMGGFSIAGRGGFIDTLEKNRHMPSSASLPANFGEWALFAVMVTIGSFILVAIPYALIGRAKGYTKQYLITVFIFAIVLSIIILGGLNGLDNLLRPAVFRNIGITALIIYAIARVMKKK